jgi:hypothetical protein
VPLVGKLEDSNASDKKINHRVLSKVSLHMKEHGVADETFIYIADAAMVTEENLAQAGCFITRLPATNNACEWVILRAIEADQCSNIDYFVVIQKLNYLFDNETWSRLHFRICFA